MSRARFISNLICYGNEEPVIKNYVPTPKETPPTDQKKGAQPQQNGTKKDTSKPKAGKNQTQNQKAEQKPKEKSKENVEQKEKEKEKAQQDQTETNETKEKAPEIYHIEQLTLDSNTAIMLQAIGQAQIAHQMIKKLLVGYQSVFGNEHHYTGNG